MKKLIIIAATFTACLGLCAAVWPQTEVVEETLAPPQIPAVTAPEPIVAQNLICQQRKKRLRLHSRSRSRNLVPSQSLHRQSRHLWPKYRSWRLSFPHRSRP